MTSIVAAFGQLSKITGLVGALAITVFACASPATADTLEAVTAAGVLRVGVDVPYGKMEFRAPDGSLAGIDIDVAREIAAGLEVKAAFEIMPFAALFDALKASKVDVVISAVTITMERQKSMRFSAPYFDAALQVAVRKQDTSIQSLSDLSGKRVGVIGGTIGEDFARKSENISKDALVVFTDNDQRVEALVTGKVDAIIMHFSLRDHATLRTLDDPIAQSYYGVAGRLEDGPLMTEIDAVLRKLKRTGRLEAITRAYLD